GLPQVWPSMQKKVLGRISAAPAGPAVLMVGSIGAVPGFGNGAPGRRRGLCLPPSGGYSRRRMSTLEIRSGGAEKAQDCGLLAPDEPRPFELQNVGGKAPLLLLCDHATRFIPRSLGRLGLDAAALDRH